MADFVKFAKMRPMPDDNVAAWNRALQFVEETKPQPEPIAENESGVDTDTVKTSENHNETRS